MRALSQVVNKNPSTNNTMDNPSCQKGTVSGTPKGTRDIITIGEKKGIMLDQVAMGPMGSLMELSIRKIPSTIGSVMGMERLCASWASSFTALPTAAKREA